MTEAKKMGTKTYPRFKVHVVFKVSPEISVPDPLA